MTNVHISWQFNVSYLIDCKAWQCKVCCYTGVLIVHFPSLPLPLRSVLCSSCLQKEMTSRMCHWGARWGNALRPSRRQQNKFKEQKSLFLYLSRDIYSSRVRRPVPLRKVLTCYRSIKRYHTYIYIYIFVLMFFFLFYLNLKSFQDAFFFV